jgi:hypothetical protein
VILRIPPEVPMSRGVPDDRSVGTEVRCHRCQRVLGKIAPGQSIRDLPPCECTIRRRPATVPEGE